jgi:disulfide bond formation protein DsbB
MRALTPRRAALAILVAAAATVAGALVFEHALGLRPCQLCLVQRQPYYAALPLALVAALAPPRLARIALGLLAALFLASAGLGLHHAGVEWGWWAGPNDCGGTPAPVPGTVGGFLEQLETARVVSCTEAAWRFLGLSLAGWNALISIGLAGFAALAAARAAPGRQGSSSLSQYR